MSELIVVGFKDEHKAEEVRMELLRLQKEHLVALEDAAVAIKKADGNVKIKQVYNLTASGALSGSFWGLLLGTFLFAPLTGLVAGAAAGAISGALADIGVDDNFIKELTNTLEPGSSALFVLVRKVTPDKVLEDLSQYEGKVLRTSLTKDDEAKLQEVLSKVEVAS
ncbi:membrane protein of uknown function UCP014873 [Thalassoporum mexicanum PCC 7367]|uniref:DUF1269 domain-containing protein n=1 Tax=Thalassoporum mexicanum TaxID=3457544 RepID=UPI00029FFFFA|nr:DUF1269 domain-containing protein [Pseudanabaena sp. PCC 7367]AFY71228.1 membrane protein of uknown function UCP014873 [Pseudanabaena sp. PCC 7367]